MAASADRLAVEGAVLCGGASRRMGTDKATMVVGGAPLVRRSVDALRAAGIDEVTLVGGDAPALRSVGVPHVPDEVPGAGPLGGIITALGASAPATQCVVVLACDLLRPPVGAIGTLVDAVLAGADVAVPVVDDREQWLFAAWSPGTAARLRDAFDTGTRAPRLVRGLRVDRLVDVDPDVSLDADTPADLLAD